MNGAGSPVTIHPVRSADDLQAVRQLFVAYVAALGVDLGFQDFAGEFAGLPGAYAPPGGELLLARTASGDLAGCVAVRPLQPTGCCEMKRLYVAPAARGYGVGSALIAAVADVARRLGYREMWLDTLPDMHVALALYRRAGFVAASRYYETPLTDAVFLKLALNSAAN